MRVWFLSLSLPVKGFKHKVNIDKVILSSPRHRHASMVRPQWALSNPHPIDHICNPLAPNTWSVPTNSAPWQPRTAPPNSFDLPIHVHETRGRPALQWYTQGLCLPFSRLGTVRPIGLCWLVCNWSSGVFLTMVWVYFEWWYRQLSDVGDHAPTRSFVVSNAYPHQL